MTRRRRSTQQNEDAPASSLPSSPVTSPVTSSTPSPTWPSTSAADLFQALQDNAANALENARNLKLQMDAIAQSNGQYAAQLAAATASMDAAAHTLGSSGTTAAVAAALATFPS